MNPGDVVNWMHEHFPNSDKLVNQLRIKRQDYDDWPEWCLLPVSAWQAIVAEEYKVSRLSSLQLKKSTFLAAVGSWRYSQSIYRFTPSFYRKLIHEFKEQCIDEEDFYSLPEWAIYIETPELFWNKKPLEGFWFYLAWDNEEKEAQLNLLLNKGNRLKLISLPLISLYKIRPNSQNNSNLFLLILLTHYVCCHHKEFYSEHNIGHYPEKQRAKLYKGAMRLYPTSRQIVWKISGGQNH